MSNFKHYKIMKKSFIVKKRKGELLYAFYPFIRSMIVFNCSERFFSYCGTGCTIPVCDNFSTCVNCIHCIK